MFAPHVPSTREEVEDASILNIEEKATVAMDSGYYPQFRELIAEFKSKMEREPSILDWDAGLNLSAVFPQLAIFSPSTTNGRPALPYLDRSVDIVVLSSSDPDHIQEARRLAAVAIVKVIGEFGQTHQIEPQFRLITEWQENAISEALLTSTSIIIPVFNKVEYTENCLEQLRMTLPHDFSGEIILVDDASTDDTPSALERWAALDRRIKVIRNPRNLGFIRSCNRGAEAASGEIIVFLNNDTLPQPGWLPPLLRVLRERPDAGAVGGKLIYPDGTLQEAGGIIFSDGSGCNFGKYDRSANSPVYNFVREVDYCSGALLATRSDLFTKLGGFDVNFAPAYYEDTDYCFSLR
ncbi:MAG TPA: glycosyltransferase family 2 protein, partial [Blastocatellia bacterium]|nr:glycosyltransferase family 2 protein [Blastocatellia bacterium]